MSPNALSSLALNTARDGAFTTSLGKPFQYLSILTVKNFFLLSNLNFPCLSLNPLPLVLSLQSLMKSICLDIFFLIFLYHSESDSSESESDEMMNEESSETDRQREERENKFSFFPNEDQEEYIFFQKTLTAVKNWFTLFGWPKGQNPISIPYSLRRDVCKVQTTSSQDKVFKQNHEKDTKTLYDMLFHLSGQLLPDITLSQALVLDPTERMLQLHCQHSILLSFLKCHGAYLPHVMPEFLLEPHDYKKWIKIYSNKDLLILKDNVFETMSKRAWTDVLLQIYKVFVLPHVFSHNITDQLSLENEQNMPRIKSEPLSSNIYSPYERTVLTWLNKHYEKNRKTVWKDCQKVPPMRWIVNFDRDLLDGLVLAAQLAAYCPYLIATHFVRMYTKPRTPEQFLHNSLILVDAMQAISLAIDIKVNDFVLAVLIYFFFCLHFCDSNIVHEIEVRF
uniref:Cilia- and flagella-associated protein 47 domain-containing protein n=1 Tax=Amazona collaria TaxID=241587 RepID=A0A8B9FE65_9PSIT